MTPLGIYPKERKTGAQTSTRTYVFTAADDSRQPKTARSTYVHRRMNGETNWDTLKNVSRAKERCSDTCYNVDELTHVPLSGRSLTLKVT